MSPDSVGLGAFGRHSGFYPRQIRTWTAIDASQAAVRDVETGKPVGDLPHMADLVAFFADAKSQPRDRATMIHGDYKIDNLVFHKTEPRVIGILEYVRDRPPSLPPFFATILLVFLTK